MPWFEFICFGDCRVDCANLLISVRMRAPSAPHMSSGSRATRRNLKRDHPIPSDELRPLLFNAEKRRRVRTHRMFHRELSGVRISALQSCATRYSGADRVNRNADQNPEEEYWIRRE